ncbi:MAG: hypothetical protein MJ187_04225 [Alphaproteobacteria bacterium]|nr:hypothetical protein [Alphaproteobacteria bacterium]
MKHLTDADIEDMARGDFAPDLIATRRSVRAHLRLSQRMPIPQQPIPENAVLDLHQRTEEQSWNAIMRLASSGVRRATIITGASGILKIKFQEWARNSILAPYIQSVSAINNGSFAVVFAKQSKTQF